MPVAMPDQDDTMLPGIHWSRGTSMLDRVSLLTLAIVVGSVLTVLLGLFVLIDPVGNQFAGDGQNSNALTAAIALIIVTLGLVLSVYMQSAEYRRESEIVDGIQEIRIVLTLLASRFSLQRVGNSMGTTISSEEREVLISAITGPAGRFLNYLRGVRDREATKNNTSTEWRTLFLHYSSIIYASDVEATGRHIVSLLKIIDSVTVRDIKKYASKVVSVNSIDQIRSYDDDLIVKVLKNMFAEKEKAPVTDAEFASLEGIISDLTAYLNTAPNGAGALKEIEPIMAKAREKDSEAFHYISQLHASLKDKFDKP